MAAPLAPLLDLQGLRYYRAFLQNCHDWAGAQEEVQLPHSGLRCWLVPLRSAEGEAYLHLYEQQADGDESLCNCDNCRINGGRLLGAAGRGRARGDAARRASAAAALAPPPSQPPARLYRLQDGTTTP